MASVFRDAQQKVWWYDSTHAPDPTEQGIRNAPQQRNRPIIGKLSGMTGTTISARLFWYECDLIEMSNPSTLCAEERETKDYEFRAMFGIATNFMRPTANLEARTSEHDAWWLEP